MVGEHPREKICKDGVFVAHLFLCESISYWLEDYVNINTESEIHIKIIDSFCACHRVVL